MILTQCSIYHAQRNNALRPGRLNILVNVSQYPPSPTALHTSVSLESRELCLQY